jgi:transcriptional/translational regulatory protein YebC/TACO1
VKNIIATEYPISDDQKKDLRTLLISPAYGLLREIIAAHCTKHQVDFANKSMYPNDNAEAQAKEAQTQAARFMNTLDVLDDVQKLEDGWIRISLEQRR